MTPFPFFSRTLFAGLLFSVLSASVAAEPLFFDDFEDRAESDEKLGRDWTWYDMTFGGDTCTGPRVAEFGPFSDGNGDDYEHDNRNFFNAGGDNGDSYYRAGLEVPAWDGGLSNMLRVYGNQYAEAASCQRTHIFQELEITEPGPYSFSFDSAQDRFGAPANGEITAGFIKVLRQSDLSYEEILVETVVTTLVEGSGALVFQRNIDFVLTEEHVGELLQFGFYNDVTRSLGQDWGTSGIYYDNVKLDVIAIGPGHSGTYFNADQDGHGFSIEFGELGDGSPIGVVYWYTYDDMGNNVYMIGAGTPDGNTLEVTFTSALGMVYGDFDPKTVNREEGGTGVFTFTSRGSAEFDYTPSGFSDSTFGHTTPIEGLELSKLFRIPADNDFGDIAQ